MPEQNNGWVDSSQQYKSVCFTQEDLNRARANATAKNKDPEKFVLMPEVIGIFRGTSEIPTPKGPMTVYNLEQENGELLSVPRSTVLNTKFAKGYKGGPIPVGILVKIRYLGEQASKGTGGNTYKNFSVMIKEAQFTEVAPTEGADEPIHGEEDAY